MGQTVCCPAGKSPAQAVNVTTEPRRALPTRRRLQLLLAHRSANWLSRGGPTSRHRDEFIAAFWPIVQRLRIKVRAVGPLYGSECRIQLDGVEHFEILQGRKHLALQHRPKVDSLLAPVFEPQYKRIRPDDFKVFHAMNGVTHVVVPPHRNGSIFSVGRPDCKSFQSCRSSSRWISAQASTSRCWVRGRSPPIHSTGSSANTPLGILIRRMKVRPVMRGADFHEHSNDDSEESRDLRHRLIPGLLVSRRPSNVQRSPAAAQGSDRAVVWCSALLDSGSRCYALQESSDPLGNPPSLTDIDILVNGSN